jgi:cell division protein FtsB
MEWGGPVFVLSLIAISTLGWIINTAVRAKHGYPLNDDWSGPKSAGRIGEERKMELLTNENDRLQGQVSRLEERIAVLERIATDPAERTARAIDALR